MEEEEARLKALLEQTEDFDERRKIRADLRTVRKKMLDTLSATAEAESSERAARRAERARARKAEEDSSNHTGPAITDKVLAEIDDEETLQTLLNEIPTSQIEDRRRIRARIREVKRKNAEGDKPASRTRRTRETTENYEEPTSTQDRRRHRDEANNESIQTKHDEPSSVMIETTSNDASHVTITTTSDDAPSVTIETESEEQTEEPANKITNEQSDEPSIVESTSDETSGVSIARNADEPEAVTIETSSVNHADDESEIKFKLTLRQSKDIRIEQDTEDTVEQSPDVEIDQAVEVLNEEPVATPVEIKVEHSADENYIGGGEDGGLDSAEDHGIESPENVLEGLKDEEFQVEEDTKESRREPVEKVNGEIDDEQPVNVGEGMSVEFKIGGEVNLNIDREEESQNKSKQDSGIKEAGNTDTADGGHISKDKRSESNASNTPSEGQPTTKPGSRWPPQNQDKKKQGRVNQVDFRNNLKKSGKIGQGKGVVSLEKKNTTAGAQVDFRAENLKKSGRIGAGTVNLENRISTQGAQVDFRGSSLKPSGKLATGVVHLERKTNTAGAQVDFRGALKKGASPSVTSPAGSEKKGSLKSETPGSKDSQKSEEAQQPAEASEQEQPDEKSERAPEDDASTENQDNAPAPIKITIPAPAEKKAPVKEPKPVRTKNEKSSARNEVEPARNEVEPARNESESTRNGSAAEENINAPEEDKDGENGELPAQVELKFDLKIDNVEASPAPSVNDKEVTPAPKVKEVPEAKGKTESKYKPRDSYKTREETKTVGGGKNKLFGKLSKFQAKDETAVKPKVEENIDARDDDKDGENSELPAQVDLKFDLKIDNVETSPAPSVNDKEVTPAPKVKEIPEAKGKTESKYKPRDSYKTREETKTVDGGKNKLFGKLSKFQAKDETAVKPKGYIPGTRSSQKKEPAPADKAVNGIAVKVENTSITAKEPESPVQIEVTEHVEDDGDTHTEVREEKTTKQDGDGVEEKEEVTTTTKTTTPGGGKMTTQTKETKTTTKKTFMDPEMQKRMAQRQKERVMAKREEVSSAKNKRMAFMQKLEANSPAQKGPSNIKRSGSNVDKLLAWCRFKLRDYEGVKLSNFSSSWGDGLAFCALIHLYLPDKVPYEELLAGGDKRRNFEVAFGAATEAGVAELLEVDDMLSCANPEPKSVMTYVSSIYKHFNPS